VELSAIVPELLLAGACLVLVPMAGLLRGGWGVLVPAVAGLALAGAIAATIPTLAWAPRPVFHGTYELDGLAQVSKLLVLAGALATLAMLAAYFRGHAQLAHAPVALLFATLGAVGVTSARDLGLLLLLLEMTSFAGYLLAALVRGSGRALEATLKYLLFGAVALAVMGYGLTFLYGLTGSLDLAEIGAALAGADRAWVILALALVLVGFGFEIAAVPLHFWMPDVLDGATAPAAGFLSVVPKIAATAALVRVLVTAFPGELGAWPELVAGIAAVTMTFGNVAALRQTGLKRLLAYSSVAQAGYVLVAVAAAGRVDRAPAAVAFYLAAYLFMNLGAFAFAAQLERTTGTDRLAGVGGLARRSPGAALVFAAALLSLAGIPPLAGFAGKVLVLEVALAGGLAWLAVVAAVNWVVALVYYVGPIARMVLDAADPEAPRLGGALGWIAGALLLGTVALGVVPGAGLEVLGRAASLRVPHPEASSGAPAVESSIDVAERSVQRVRPVGRRAEARRPELAQARRDEAALVGRELRSTGGVLDPLRDLEDGVAVVSARLPRGDLREDLDDAGEHPRVVAREPDEPGEGILDEAPHGERRRDHHGAVEVVAPPSARIRGVAGRGREHGREVVHDRDGGRLVVHAR